MDLTDIYRIFLPRAAKYSFCSAVHECFSKINNTLGNKSSLNKYYKIEITTCSLPDCKRIKIDINSKRNYRKCSNTQRLKIHH
jgi:hypothetical protein